MIKRWHKYGREDTIKTIPMCPPPNCFPFADAWVHPRFLVGSVLLIVLVFCVAFLLGFVCLRAVVCTLCCQFLWIVHSWLPLRFSVTFIIYSRHTKINFWLCNIQLKFEYSCLPLIKPPLLQWICGLYKEGQSSSI